VQRTNLNAGKRLRYSLFSCIVGIRRNLASLVEVALNTPHPLKSFGLETTKLRITPEILTLIGCLARTGLRKEDLKKASSSAANLEIYR